MPAKYTCMLLLLLSFTNSCTKDDKLVYQDNILVESKFDNSNEGWIADFADYPLGAEDAYELQSRHSKLPAPLDQNDGAIFISGKNESDDLFMYLKKQITNLKPDSDFKAHFTLEFASNAPTGAIGIGGAPGESVYLGIGITAQEPAEAIDDEGLYRINIDKGQQATEGKDRKIIGNIANGTGTDEYVLLKKEGDFQFKTDQTGIVWAIVSTDSGFEGTTAIYYTAIKIEITKM